MSIRKRTTVSTEYGKSSYAVAKKKKKNLKYKRLRAVGVAMMLVIALTTVSVMD